jgi:hypothetical protein
LALPVLGEANGWLAGAAGGASCAWPAADLSALCPAPSADCGGSVRSCAALLKAHDPTKMIVNSHHFKRPPRRTLTTNWAIPLLRALT